MIRELDTIHEPNKLYEQASYSLDSMNCDYVMEIAAYAKRYQWHSLYLRCVTRAIELGGDLIEEPDHANLVFKALKDGPDSTFYWDTVDSLDGVFLRRNQTRIATREVLNTLSSRDQVRSLIYRSLPQEVRRTQKDTTWTTADSVVAFIDSENFEDLLNLCKIHGELPLSDRYGYRASGVVTMILHHNGKNRRGFNERWRAIWPYIIDAMDNCRTGSTRFLQLYEYTYSKVHGCQWFGLMEDYPIKPGNVAERRAKRIIE